MMQRRAHYDHGWTLENKNVILWSVDEMSPQWARMSSRHAAAAARLSGNRHAREARELLSAGRRLQRGGGTNGRASPSKDAVAHAGGTLASLPSARRATHRGRVGREERYQTDPGAILVELQEGAQLETVWHERNNRLARAYEARPRRARDRQGAPGDQRRERASVNVPPPGRLSRTRECIRPSKTCARARSSRVVRGAGACSRRLGRGERSPGGWKASASTPLPSVQKNSISTRWCGPGRRRAETRCDGRAVSNWVACARQYVQRRREGGAAAQPQRGDEAAVRIDGARRVLATLRALDCAVGLAERGDARPA